MTREEINEHYLLLALDELSKHRGSIKKGRKIESQWRHELLYGNLEDPFIDLKKSSKSTIKLNLKSAN